MYAPNVFVQFIFILPPYYTHLIDIFQTEQKCKRPVSDVRTAPRTLGWFDESNIPT